VIGRGVVSEEFCRKKWLVESVDNDVESNATIVQDVTKIDPRRDFQRVPDFIWASPPCQTYSRLAGGKHRSLSDPDRSATAREHDLHFTKLMEICHWAKEKHPHMILVVENPVGLMKSMPLMQRLQEDFGLNDPVEVNYCAFGREERKATNLWTNHAKLRDALSVFTCEKRCQRSQNHTSIRGNTSKFDFSAIPEPLAEEVADTVHSIFKLKDIRRKTQAAEP